MPNVAVIGAGYWGKNLVRVLREIGALYAVCDNNQQNPNISSLNGIKLFTDYGDLLSDPEVHAVAIATPAVMHFDMATRALSAGKDVYVEKPLALTEEEGKRIVELAREEERILMVGHILRYHPAVTKLKELISSGELGRIEYIYSNRLNIGKLRTEENILWSFAPHDISVILMLLDQEPLKVAAFGGDYLNKGIYDTTLTTLEFANGVKGHIFVSWLHPYKEQKLIVVGSKAMAVFDDVSSEKLFLYPHRIEWKDGRLPVAQKADYRVLAFPPGEPLKEELTHFLECVTQRQKPLTDGEEGMRVLKILQMAETSLRNGNASSHSRTASFSPPHVASGDYFLHETASVDDRVKIGQGTKIWHFSHILSDSKLGRDCIIGQNVSVGPDVTIGNGCKIQNNVSIYKGVTLEDGVFCGPSCVFTNVYNPRAFIERKTEFLRTVVKKGATIGANATIVCGVTIGSYAMVAAGAVIKTDVPDFAIFAGVPAVQKGWACRCGTSLRFNGDTTSCTYCGSEYRNGNGGITVLKEKTRK